MDTDVKAELEAIAQRHDCELIHLDFAGGRLRLILDNPEGVTIEHCEKVSRDASAMLDVSDFGSGRYTLEVSSPGLDRELVRPQDYERFAGSRIKLTWTDAETTRQRTDVGVLTAYRAADQPTIDLQIDDEAMRIQLASIICCRLDPEL